MSELGEITACYTITFERRSRHPVARLWRAITDPERVSAWMGYPARIDLRPGGDWYVDFGERGDLDGVIVRVEPERRLRLAWGLSMLDWALAPDGDGCRYTFVHHGQTPRPIPDEEGLAAGWHSFLESLAAHLDGRDFGSADDAAVTAEVSPAYRERLQAVLS